MYTLSVLLCKILGKDCRILADGEEEGVLLCGDNRNVDGCTGLEQIKEWSHSVIICCLAVQFFICLFPPLD